MDRSKSIGRPSRPALFALRNLGRNLRALGRRPRVLAVRHESLRPYRNLLAWLDRHDPRTRALFDLRCLGERIWGLDRYGVVLNWTQDPLHVLDPEGYAWMRALEDRAAAAGIPVVNPTDVQARGRKSVQARLLREAGFDIPPVGRPEDFPFPIVVFSDVLHTRLRYRIDSRGELERFDWSRLDTPRAAPFVETRCADGLYRRWRYVMVGERGARWSLIVSRHWCAHRTRGEDTVDAADEERAFVEADELEHDLFARARRVLGFDLVAFDYSRRRDGSLVIWEANPFPGLNAGRGSRAGHRELAERRVYGMIRDAVVSALRAPRAPAPR